MTSRYVTTLLQSLVLKGIETTKFLYTFGLFSRYSVPRYISIVIKYNFISYWHKPSVVDESKCQRPSFPWLRQVFALQKAIYTGMLDRIA
jgi:hypothetical protein